MSEPSKDWLREHWRRRRIRLQEELKGMDMATQALFNVPEGDELRTMIAGQIALVRASVQELDELLRDKA